MSRFLDSGCYSPYILGMFQYTHNNHFRVGYDGGWDFLPTADSRTMNVDYGTTDYISGSFVDECVLAARRIYNNAGDLPLNLSFSGGVDSEVMIRAFELAEVPFRISILCFEYTRNLHDISFAISYCESKGLKYDIMHLDVERFFGSDEFLEIATRTKCVSPQIVTHIWLLQNMEGLPVFGCGEGGLVKQVPNDYVPGVSPYTPSEWHLPVSEKQMAMYRHCLRTKQKAVPGFFRYTPGQLYTFMDNPIVRELAADQRIGKLSSQTSKAEIYRTWFPDMLHRPKYQGFEKMMNLDRDARSFLLNKMPQYDREASIEYHALMKKLYRDY